MARGGPRMVGAGALMAGVLSRAAPISGAQSFAPHLISSRSYWQARPQLLLTSVRDQGVQLPQSIDSTRITALCSNWTFSPTDCLHPVPPPIHRHGGPPSSHRLSGRRRKAHTHTRLRRLSCRPSVYVSRAVEPLHSVAATVVARRQQQHLQAPKLPAPAPAACH
ncbi:hypothetical protein COCC4DRAFT_58291 [Bipolaris maydis ATCC 48331]|uniref:Uncharacterized protein n=1 Tax=Cochliobolus heterostrophus (strain C4 / ATCC 48331 / race T) TaxID=665024 RepID=N4X6W1_COCH4|nr:uncharacterized protein COCC4DRAFT_58291 [Bipolaris maydis ATCC 48331]ENI07395.1 hypothetical protein COCC4DRAFT_58291 [Bipolaris maydis ATCC 48331]